ncbi:MAG: hypothetical protein PHY50_02110 [Sideroxydans sp.]|nr:hypothetical protein [Sideroxydans sp.]
MNTIATFRIGTISAVRQRGVVLFFALVALVAMSLAAVALIRSVDTSTIIAGNLAFKQSATNSGDGGLEAAFTWLATVQAANSSLIVLNDATHPFNLTCLAVRAAGTLSTDDPGCPAIIPGYHSSIDPSLDLTDDATWDDVNSVSTTPDGSGNTTRYIIQRACRNGNQPVQTAGCLFGGTAQTRDGMHVKPPQAMCDGPGCPPAGQSPQNRVTARTKGPRNTVSFVQAFAY